MTRVLKNKNLEVIIGNPMELYQGARFDHSGNIFQVTLNGKHTFFTCEKSDYSNLSGFGLLNEFDIDEPATYQKVNVGNPFLKIGVGSLLKDEERSYNFFKEYQNNPLEYKILTEGDDLLTFQTVSPKIKGVQFEYQKTIFIKDQFLFIYYVLNNIGTETIDTNEYCHNFISLDNKHLNGAYKLSFENDIITDCFDSIINAKGVLSFSNNEIKWIDKPTNDFFIAGLQCTDKKVKWWQLENNVEKFGIREEVDFECSKVNLWGTTHVVSPELFHHIVLEPGQQSNWCRKYTFFD